jgi:hypothetical protein
MIGEKWFEVTPAGDYEGSFLAGAGLRYDLKNCFGFVFNSEYTYNVMDYDFIQTDGQIRTDERVLSFVNLIAGVVFKLP